MDNLGAIAGPLLALALVGLVGTRTGRLGDRRGAVLVLERAVARRLALGRVVAAGAQVQVDPVCRLLAGWRTGRLTGMVGRLAVSLEPSLDARRTRWHWRLRVAR